MSRPSRRSRLVVVTVIAALAAAPAGALAQDGAGDDQYTDPFGETTPQGSTETTITPTPAPAPTPAPGAQRSAPAPKSSAAAPAATGTPAATGVAAAPAEPALANTGFDTRILLLAGVALMAAGAALRFGLRSR